MRREFALPGRHVAIDFLRARDNTFRCTAFDLARTVPAVEFTLRIHSTLCNFGGSRPWLGCPECGGLRGKLYVDGLRLRCRRCAGLIYESQNKDASARLGARIEALRRQLGDPGDGTGRLPKPRGMHWSTYGRLREELRELEWKTLAIHGAFLEQLEQRVQKLARDAGVDL